MLQSPTKLKGLLTGALALGAVVATTHAASAQTFAQFLQLNPASQDFVFTNTGAGATFTATSNVFFLASNGFTSPGILTFSGTADGIATGSTSLRQNIINATLSIRSGDGLTNYLTATGTGFLVGDNSTGITSASFQASQNGTPPDSLVFSSQVIPNLANSTNRNYSISLSSLNGYTIGANGMLNSFTAAGTGTFAANIPTVPEPGTVAGMVALGGSMCGLIVRARRRTVKANA